MAKGKIAMALGFPESDSEDDSDDDSVESKKEPDQQNKAEVLAMKQFMRAETAEAKATAMKDFMEACGVY